MHKHGKLAVQDLLFYYFEAGFTVFDPKLYSNNATVYTFLRERGYKRREVRTLPENCLTLEPPKTRSPEDWRSRASAPTARKSSLGEAGYTTR
jgi:hypothetical protein